MKNWGKAIIGSAFVAGALGCASDTDKPWYQDVQQTSTKVAVVATKAADSTAQTAAAAYQRMQHYLAEKDVLKTFEDAGEHSETEVLTVLHRSRSASATAPGTAAGTNPKSASHSGAAAPQTPAPALPQQYPGSLRWPLDAGIVSSEYGERWGKVHKGMDIAADIGEPVYAIADGQVIYAGNGLRGYGNVVILKHDSHMSSLYAHNSELKVKQGDMVTKGTLVALLGSTGHSTGPHVHFEIRDGDVAVNPRTLLPKSKFAMLDEPAARSGGNLLSQR